MSRKDYQKLVAALAIHKPVDSNETLDIVRAQQFKRIVHSVADVLQADNARFDRARFLRAAGAL